MKFGRRLRRGATMVEYAILIVGIILVTAGAIKFLGGAVRARVENAGDVATTSGGPDAPAGAKKNSTTTMDDGTAPPAATSDLTDNGFGLKRALAIAMIALGLGSVGYFFVRGKKAVSDVKQAK